MHARPKRQGQRLPCRYKRGPLPRAQARGRSDDGVDAPLMAMWKPSAPITPTAVLALLLCGACAPGVLARGSRATRGEARAHAAIVGGTTAQAGAFASVAEVLYLEGEQGSQCTGTVVAADLVLTAGHCAENMGTGAVNRASGYRVLTNATGSAGLERQVSTVSGVIVYDGFVRRSDDGDAALLVLSTPTTAPPVALPASHETGAPQAGTTVTIAGWGDTRYQQRAPTEGLRWADTVVQNPRWCARYAPPFFSGSELCTIDPPGYATGACHGDSGGPLLAPEGPGGGLVQIGITIHGYGRCSTRLPSVFTRVEPIASWVDTWIAAYMPPTPSPAP
jgi:trypsin